MKKKTSRRRVDVNVEELDRVIDETEKGPLSEADRQKLKNHAACAGGISRATAE